MTTKELIEELQKMPQDKECLLGIDKSAGFPNDHIDVFPIEEIFTSPWCGSTPLSGYTSEGLPDDLSEQYVILYVFP
jgi:hypothetical protein